MHEDRWLDVRQTDEEQTIARCVCLFCVCVCLVVSDSQTKFVRQTVVVLCNLMGFVAASWWRIATMSNKAADLGR